MATNTENLESGIRDRVKSSAVSDRQRKLQAISEGLQRWLLSLNLDADENEVVIKTQHRKPTPERPWAVVVVHQKHTNTDGFSFILEPEEIT